MGSILLECVLDKEVGRYALDSSGSG